MNDLLELFAVPDAGREKLVISIDEGSGRAQDKKAASCHTEDDPDDDFGAFVEPPQRVSPDVHVILSVDVDRILDYITKEILTMPEPFFEELSGLTHTLRRRIINDARTKFWIAGIVKGSILAQRFIHGRNRRTKAGTTENECAYVSAQRLCQQWSSIIPRLRSLSNGSQQYKPLSMTAYKEDHDTNKVCAICATTDKELLQIYKPGLLVHAGCLSILVKVTEGPKSI